MENKYANDLQIIRESKSFADFAKCRTFVADFSTITLMRADKIYTLEAKRLTYSATRRLLLCLVFMFAGCGVSQDNNQEETEEFSIVGTWELNELLFLSGQRVDVRTGNEYVWYRFYEDNGTYYAAELNNSDARKPLKPHEMSEYFFMMSPYDTIYIEHGRMTNLKVMDNHTIGIDRGDYVEMYVKRNDLSCKMVSEIERSVEGALQPAHGRKTQYIVPISSAADTTSFWILLVVLVAIVCAGALYIFYRLRIKRKEPVTEKDVEKETEKEQDKEQCEQTFIHSDYYLALRQRLYEGPTLKHDEWEELEMQMKRAYPMFFRKLAEKCQFSEVELRVCMLTKLGIPPSAIAIHTCREYSTISSIRSRLYYKIFGIKGGAKDLDEFIQNL